MQIESKEMVLKSAIGLAGTTASIELATVSVVVSILVGLVTGMYMLVQLIKFLRVWGVQEEARKLRRDGKPHDTDLGKFH